jgi:hypothetical protein
MLFIFSPLVLNRHLWQLKTVVFPHWCLIRAHLLFTKGWMGFLSGVELADGEPLSFEFILGKIFIPLVNFKQLGYQIIWQLTKLNEMK